MSVVHLVVRSEKTEQWEREKCVDLLKRERSPNQQTERLVRMEIVRAVVHMRV